MNYSDIRRLVKLVERSRIAELEIEGDGSRVKILKYSSPNGTVDYGAGSPVNQLVTSQLTASAPPVAEPSQPEPTVKSNLVEVTSPMVGTFYRAPTPEAPAYVEVGDHVRPGQVLCIIEAMKLMNELEAEISGRIEHIAIENAQPVEFGQPLFRIEPD